mmetsp:Transcript_27759/g.46593  ORF Transcript_27759/g.46593 Transcript_27759/m.46593 type:complete len:92 (-) Transcript_27759:3281-3556(-)
MATVAEIVAGVHLSKEAVEAHKAHKVADGLTLVAPEDHLLVLVLVPTPLHALTVLSYPWIPPMMNRGIRSLSSPRITTLTTAPKIGKTLLE